MDSSGPLKPSSEELDSAATKLQCLARKRSAAVAMSTKREIRLGVGRDAGAEGQEPRAEQRGGSALEPVAEADAALLTALVADSSMGDPNVPAPIEEVAGAASAAGAGNAGAPEVAADVARDEAGDEKNKIFGKEPLAGAKEAEKVAKEAAALKVKADEEACAAAALAARLADVFSRFDWDGTGSLSTVELANAASEHWGAPPTPGQLAALLEAAGVARDQPLPTALSLEQFAKAMASHPQPEAAAKRPEIYVLDVPKRSLGFNLALDAARGVVEVAKVTDKAMALRGVTTGDRVVFIAGKPLGKVGSLKEGFTQLIKAQPRPVQITLLRAPPKP